MNKGMPAEQASPLLFVCEDDCEFCTGPETD